MYIYMLYIYTHTRTFQRKAIAPLRGARYARIRHRTPRAGLQLWTLQSQEGQMLPRDLAGVLQMAAWPTTAVHCRQAAAVGEACGAHFAWEAGCLLICLKLLSQSLRNEQMNIMYPTGLNNNSC